MGGFVLIHTVAGEDRSATQESALAVFARMGMPSPRLLRGENYVLAVYPKRQAPEPALRQFPDGDFVYTCGTAQPQPRSLYPIAQRTLSTLRKRPFDYVEDPVDSGATVGTEFRLSLSEQIG